MNKRENQIEDLINNTNDPKMWKLWLGSNVIPKKYKRNLLRKLFKSNIKNTFGASPIISLEDIHQLIKLSSSNEQTRIYITAAIDIFGQKGKRLV